MRSIIDRCDNSAQTRSPANALPCSTPLAPSQALKDVPCSQPQHQPPHLRAEGNHSSSRLAHHSLSQRQALCLCSCMFLTQPTKQNRFSEKSSLSSNGSSRRHVPPIYTMQRTKTRIPGISPTAAHQRVAETRLHGVFVSLYVSQPGDELMLRFREG